MAQALTLTRSTIGKKAVMAASGVVLFGYLVGHLLGNLQIYLGREVLNEYAAFLHNSPALLWGTRAVLLISVVAHVTSAIQLASRNAEARPVRYKHWRGQQSDYASRTMYWSGPILALFIVYHLLHLTLGYAPAPHQHDPNDVYANLVNGFSVPLVSAAYIVSMLALGMHLYHGAWSIFQTLGANHPRYNAWRRRFAAGLTAFIVLGNISIPTSVMLGVVGLDAAADAAGEETTEDGAALERTDGTD